VSKRRLGKGIDALLQGRDLEQLDNMSSVLLVDIDKLQPNPNQPRNRFDDTTLSELASSIQEKGLIQPIIAEDRGDGTFVIVAGERRYRAARIAGLDQVPVLPRDFSPEEKIEIALVENIQREDLNPIDEALAFESVMDNGGYTQDQLAKRLGMSRPAVANALRLLKLETDIRESIAAGEISAGHARALLAVEGGERRTLFERIRADGLSVRDAEAAVRSAGPGSGSTLADGATGSPETGLSPDEASGRGEVPLIENEDALEVPAGPRRSPELDLLEDELVRKFGTKVLVRGSDTSGRIEMSYYSPDDLNRLIDLLGITLDQ